MQKIAKENIYTAFITNAKNGALGDISGQASELIAEAIVKSMNDRAFSESLPSIAGNTTSGAMTAAFALYNGGSVSVSNAYKEFVYCAMDVFPAAKLGKAVVGATKAGSTLQINTFLY